MTELKKIKEAIKNLNLSREWKDCKINSDKLYDYLKEGKSVSPTFIDIEGLSPYGSHYVYISQDDKWVVDLVIHNQKSIYSLIKSCETMKKGIFKKRCYFNKLNAQI